MAIDPSRLMRLIDKVKSKFPAAADSPEMQSLEAAVDPDASSEPDGGDDNTDGDQDDTDSDNDGDTDANPTDGDVPSIVGDDGDGGEGEDEEGDEPAKDTTGLFSSFAMKGPPPGARGEMEDEDVRNARYDSMNAFGKPKAKGKGKAKAPLFGKK